MPHFARSGCLAATCCLLLMLSVSSAQQSQQNADRWKRMDGNGDGKVTKEEMPAQARNRFGQIDTNGDGSISREEFDAYARSRNARDRAPQPPAPTPSVDPSSEPRADRQAGAKAPAPTHADVSYGEHDTQAFDIWLAESKDGKPTPLVIYIHGGGFRGGDKKIGDSQPVGDYLDQGISFASMNYRLSDVGPYPIMMHDAARGLQTIRSKAKDWNLDSQRIACYGGSAGAGISLWLGFHDDLADPDSQDPIARQSTRIVAAGTSGGQSTYDMRTFREWFDVPNLEPHPALVAFYGVNDPEDWESDRVKSLMTDASAITHLTKDDPPVFMTYGKGDVPVDEKTDPGVWVHHARLGLKLKEAMDKLGLECHVTWNGHPSEAYEDIHAFLQDKVQGASNSPKAPGNAKRFGASARQGRIKPNGEFYAPPALQERVDSPLKVGDKAPEFALPTSDGGAPVSLSQLIGKKPVVLVFGSITCSPFRQKVLEVFDIHKRYADRAEFLMIYIREAHPESTILVPQETGPSVLTKFVQTDSLAAPRETPRAARNCCRFPFPC